MIITALVITLIDANSCVTVGRQTSPQTYMISDLFERQICTHCTVCFENTPVCCSVIMGEREQVLFFQKQELLKKRKQLLDIKLQLQKDVHTAEPIDFGRKYGTQSAKDTLSVADRLHHRFSDVRFLEKLECHLLCGLKVINYNESKLVVQFRPSYMEKILPEVYAISLLAGNNGYRIEKYYLPLSVQVQRVVQQWSPLRQENLKHFLLDIKQQINAFHHRQNQILQLQEWANNKNIALKVFHPLSLNYIIITAPINDSLKSGNCISLNLIFNYDSNHYLPTTIDVESSEMEEEELAAAKEQFSAFKLYSLKKASELCFIKTERFSLPANEEVQNENLNKEDNRNTSASKEEEEEENITDLSNSPAYEQHENSRMLSQVNKESKLSPMGEKARKSNSKLSTEGKRNKNRDNRSSVDENDNSELSTSKAPEVIEQGRKPKLKYSAKRKRNRYRDASKKTGQFQLQLETKRSLGSVLQEAKKSNSKGKRNVASKSENNTFQTKKQLNTNRTAAQKKYSLSDVQDDILHTRQKKRPHTRSTNKETKEESPPLQTNKITNYLLRSKR